MKESFKNFAENQFGKAHQKTSSGEYTRPNAETFGTSSRQTTGEQARPSTGPTYEEMFKTHLRLRRDNQPGRIIGTWDGSLIDRIQEALYAAACEENPEEEEKLTPGEFLLMLLLSLLGAPLTAADQTIEDTKKQAEKAAA